MIKTETALSQWLKYMVRTISSIYTALMNYTIIYYNNDFTERSIEFVLIYELLLYCSVM